MSPKKNNNNNKGKNGAVKTVDITKEHFSDYEKNVQVNTSVIDYHLGNMNIAFQELISQIGSHSKMYLSNITPKGVGKVLFSEDVASSTDERIINLHASILMNERANENNSQLKFRYSSNSLEHDETEEKIDTIFFKPSGLISPNKQMTPRKDSVLGESKAIQNVVINMFLASVHAFLSKSIVGASETELYLDKRGYYKTIVSKFMKRLGAMPLKDVTDLKEHDAFKHPVTGEWLNWNKKSFQNLIYSVNPNGSVSSESAFVDNALPIKNNSFSVEKFINWIMERENIKNSILELCKYSDTILTDGKLKGVGYSIQSQKEAKAIEFTKQGEAKDRKEAKENDDAMKTAHDEVTENEIGANGQELKDGNFLHLQKTDEKTKEVMTVTIPINSYFKELNNFFGGDSEIGMNNIHELIKNDSSIRVETVVRK